MYFLRVGSAYGISHTLSVKLSVIMSYFSIKIIESAVNDLNLPSYSHGVVNKGVKGFRQVHAYKIDNSLYPFGVEDKVTLPWMFAPPACCPQTHPASCAPYGPKRYSNIDKAESCHTVVAVYIYRSTRPKLRTSARRPPGRGRLSGRKSVRCSADRPHPPSG